MPDEDSEYCIESTYEEDAPYLPRTLLEFLEENSVSLGLQNQPTKFDDLQKIKEKELKMIEQVNDDSSSEINPQRETAMMFNTMRDTNMETGQPIPIQEVTTGVQRRNSDLVHQALDEASQNMQNMEIREGNRRLHAHRQIHSSQVDSENDEENKETSGRMELQTDLGINAHIATNQITNPSPMTNNIGVNDSLTNSLRERSSSRQSAIKNAKIYVSYKI